MVLNRAIAKNEFLSFAVDPIEMTAGEDEDELNASDGSLFWPFEQWWVLRDNDCDCSYYWNISVCKLKNKKVSVWIIPHNFIQCIFPYL